MCPEVVRIYFTAEHNVLILILLITSTIPKFCGGVLRKVWVPTISQWVRYSGAMSYRVLKWWCHKNLILEIMGFVGIFWKNIWKAYLPKTSIAGQIVLEIIVPFCSDWWLHTNPSKFDSVPNVMNWVKFRWICMESSLAYKWAKISKMLFIIPRKSHNFTNLIFYDATL